MIALGISGRRHRASAALAVDGRVVAAVTEAAITRVPKSGYRERGVPIGSVTTCLDIAGVPRDAIDVVVIADGIEGSLVQRGSVPAAGCGLALPRALKYRLGRLPAWSQLGAAAFNSPFILAADIEIQRAAWYSRVDGLLTAFPLVAVSELLGLTRDVSQALGIRVDDPAAALSELQSVARTDPYAGSAAKPGNATSTIDVDSFRARLAATKSEFGDTLRNSRVVQVKLQRARAELADFFLSTLAAAMAQEIDGRTARQGLAKVTLAGSAFGDPDFNARIVSASIGSVALRLAPAPVPEGAALGAALAPFTLDQMKPWPDSMAFGSSFAEADVKEALENCRLDYVYEPRWPRLMDRIARILANGKMVAWFQHSGEFCTSVGGARSILCDPSNRYARDNINRFLRQHADDMPIGLSVPMEASECVTLALRAPWTMASATIAADARDRLRAAVDGDGNAHVHVVEQSSSPLFHELLMTHWRRTGVPGLLNTALHGVGEPVASSPRDAIRTMYSSSIDAMVIHRFLVMKDYWQLRGSDA